MYTSSSSCSENSWTNQTAFDSDLVSDIFKTKLDQLSSGPFKAIKIQLLLVDQLQFDYFSERVHSVVETSEDYITHRAKV